MTRRIDTVATSRSDAHAPSPVTRHCSLERHVCILSTSINRNYRVACLQTRPYFWATSVFPWRARNNNALQRLCAGKQRSAMHTVRVLIHRQRHTASIRSVSGGATMSSHFHFYQQCRTVNNVKLNHLTPNGHFSGRTAQLTYTCRIF